MTNTTTATGSWVLANPVWRWYENGAAVAALIALVAGLVYLSFDLAAAAVSLLIAMSLGILARRS
jgi:hypothetical protein